MITGRGLLLKFLDVLMFLVKMSVLVIGIALGLGLFWYSMLKLEDSLWLNGVAYNSLYLSLGTTIAAFSALFLFLWRFDWCVKRDGSGKTELLKRRWASWLSRPEVERLALPQNSRVVLRSPKSRRGGHGKFIGSRVLFSLAVENSAGETLAQCLVYGIPDDVTEKVQGLARILEGGAPAEASFRWGHGWAFGRISTCGMLIGVALCVLAFA